MKILNIVAKKSLLGYEDLEVGYGHLEQTRNGITKKFYHKIPQQVNMGLLSTCDFNSIDGTLKELYFTGYYKEGDLGEGIYKRVGNGNTHNIGTHISNGDYIWVRIYTEYVRPEWFGAKGDGINDDADAFITALLFGSIELNGKYRIDLLKTNIIPISKNIDIIGNNSTIEINSILKINKLIFDVADGVSIKCRFVNFKSNLDKIFHFYRDMNADIKYCNFTPSDINPFNSTEYLTQQSAQALTTTTILEGLNTKTMVATNELHPINKNDLKSLKIEEIPNAVTVDGNEEIVGVKTFYKSPEGATAIDDDQIVTLAQMKELVKLPQSIKDIIDTWLQELKAGQGEYGNNECPYPVAACYIQPHGTKDPNELWPGTEWVKLEYNDGAIIGQQHLIDSKWLNDNTGVETINGRA